MGFAVKCSWKIMDPDIATKEKGATLRERVLEREGVIKVVGTPGKRDPQDLSRGKPLPGYR